MARYRIAHRRVQGQDVILIPLDHRFDGLPQQQQQEFLAYMQQQCSARYNLAGRVALVWPTTNGTRSLGPEQWASFLRSLSVQDVLANVNLEIEC